MAYEIDPDKLTVEQKLMLAKADETLHSFRVWLETTVKEICSDSLVTVETDNVRALVFSAVFNEVVVAFLSAGIHKNHFKGIIDTLADKLGKKGEGR